MSLDPEIRLAASCCFSLKDRCCNCFNLSNWFCEKLLDEKTEDLSFCNCSISLSSTFDAVKLFVPHGSLFLLVCARLSGEDGSLVAESNKEVRSDGDMVSLLLSFSN